MAAPQNELELLQLVSRIQDGRAAPEELRWIEQAVEIDERVRCAFLELMDMESEIYLQIADRRADRDQLLIDLDAILDQPASTIGADDELAVASRWQGVWTVIHDYTSNFITPSLLVAALTIAIIVLSLGLIELADEPAVRPPAAPSTEFVASITSTQQAAFDESSDGNFKNRDLFDDDKIVLNAGLVVVEYDTGARVVLEGPATYEIQGANGGALQHGTMLARAATAESSGFEVEVSGARIVDVGTEFGVNADGDTEVVVLSGVVDVVGDSREGRPGERVRLTKNQGAVVAEAGVITRLDEGAAVGRRAKFYRDFATQLADVVERSELAEGATIHVNFYASSGPEQNHVAQDAATLIGPAGGRGEVWNQFNTRSGNRLFDASGAVTTVGFHSDVDSGWVWGKPDLSLLAAGRAHFAKGQDMEFTITGLTPGGLYDMWIASAADMAEAAERAAGTWSTPNATSSEAAQGISSLSGLNGSAWEQGNNYVRFENVEADGNGEIVLIGDATDAGEVDANAYRLPLSGVQIRKKLRPASAPQVRTNETQ